MHKSCINCIKGIIFCIFLHIVRRLCNPRTQLLEDQALTRNHLNIKHLAIYSIYSIYTRVYDCNHISKYAFFAYFRAFCRAFSIFVGKYTTTQIDALKTAKNSDFLICAEPASVRTRDNKIFDNTKK